MFFKNYRQNKKKNKKKVVKPTRIYSKNMKPSSGYAVKTSKLESTFENVILKPLNVEYIRQKRINYKYFDFFIPDCNLLIEVDGDYYHAKDRANGVTKMQKKNIINDTKKNLIASQNGFHLLRFWESDIKNSPISVQSTLAMKIQNLL